MTLDKMGIQSTIFYISPQGFFFAILEEALGLFRLGKVVW